MTTSSGLSVDVNRSEPEPSPESRESSFEAVPFPIVPVSSASSSFQTRLVSPSFPHQLAGEAELDNTLPHSLARSAYEGKYLPVVWDAFRETTEAPEAPEAPAPGEEWTGGYPTADWTAISRELHHAALRKIVLATCLSTLGRDNNEPWLMREGLRFYVHALKDVNAGLRNGSLWRSDALLAASRALDNFEMMFGSDAMMQEAVSQAKSWQVHVVGEMTLIEQRGPEVHMSGQGHRLFVDGRMQLVSRVDMIPCR